MNVPASAGQLLSSAPAQAHSLAGHGYTLASHALALGGAGIGGALVHLLIWHLIWRAGLSLWRVPTVGPYLVISLIAVLVALGVVRRLRGPRWWNNRGGSTGYGTGRGPRDW